jgi:hypothetical protein
LAKLNEPIRATDITFWGVFALIAWGAAVLGAGANAILPNGILSGLHSPLFQGSNPGQLQARIADLDARISALKADNATLMDRVALSEQQRTDITKRLGALEVSMPRLIEAVNTPAPVDRSVVTGDISTAPPIVEQADGGTVAYTTTPMRSQANGASEAGAQPMPSVLPVIAPNSNAFGVALGPPILEMDGPASWKSMTDRVGTLLNGLGPLLGPIEGAPGRRLVAGPIATEAAARELCGSFAKQGIACSSVAFMGDQLPAN